METAISGGYVSADGHVVEPADLWSTHMDRRFRDRAPRVNSRPDADYYLIDGLPAMPVGLEGVWALAISTRAITKAQKI